MTGATSVKLWPSTSNRPLGMALLQPLIATAHDVMPAVGNSEIARAVVLTALPRIVVGTRGHRASAESSPLASALRPRGRESGALPRNRRGRESAALPRNRRGRERSLRFRGIVAGARVVLTALPRNGSGSLPELTD